jgi:hypothetical protein
MTKIEVGKRYRFRAEWITPLSSYKTYGFYYNRSYGHFIELCDEQCNLLIYQGFVVGRVVSISNKTLIDPLHSNEVLSTTIVLCDYTTITCE